MTPASSHREQTPHTARSNWVSYEIVQSITVKHGQKGRKRFIERIAQAARGRHETGIFLATEALHDMEIILCRPNDATEIERFGAFGQPYPTTSPALAFNKSRLRQRLHYFIQMVARDVIAARDAFDSMGFLRLPRQPHQ